MQNKDVNHLKIGELPDLRIISLDELRYHERHDRERVQRLIRRFSSEGIIKHPLVVGLIDDGEPFLILDGANRATALARLGFEHVPVQVVAFNDFGLKLSCWHHAVEKLGRKHFLEKLTELSHANRIEMFSHNQRAKTGKSIVPKSNNQDDFRSQRQLLCSLTFVNGEDILVFSSGDLLEQVQLLTRITDIYLHNSLSDRVSYTNLQHLRNNYPSFGALLTFRSFTKDDIIKLSLCGERLPAGITRVILPKRALGLNVPLDILKSLSTLEKKNRWLREMIHKKVVEKSIRFYQEQTFVFDE